MSGGLKNCWEIMNCGRGKGGARVSELGQCVASVKGLGHSCWAIAGTLCGGTVQGTAAQKQGNCLACEVYRAYNRSAGAYAAELLRRYPEEQKKYIDTLKAAHHRLGE